MLMHNDDAIMIKQRVIISRSSLIFNLLDQRRSLFMSVVREKQVVGKNNLISWFLSVSSNS